jgi:hypothetical protein
MLKGVEGSGEMSNFLLRISRHLKGGERQPLQLCVSSCHGFSIFGGVIGLLFDISSGVIGLQPNKPHYYPSNTRTTPEQICALPFKKLPFSTIIHKSHHFSQIPPYSTNPTIFHKFHHYSQVPPSALLPDRVRSMFANGNNLVASGRTQVVYR